MKIKLLLFILIIQFSACIHSNVYEKNVALNQFSWNENKIIPFEFDITDTTATYSMYFTTRHTDAYPFSNIWVNIKTQYPNADTSSTSKVEIPLATPEGKWLGRGMNEIWEHRMLIASPLHFSKKGTYIVTLQHAMRVNPLPQIMSVGIRLEKQ